MPYGRSLCPFLPTIRCSDGPKSYWGYYQDYLVQIYGKKKSKKNYIDFQQNSMTADMHSENWPKWGWRAMFKFRPKIECTRPVQYVEANMAHSCRLTCLKMEGNNLFKKIKLSRPTWHSFLPMIRRPDGPKSYWGYYQDYLVQISGKKSKKNWPRFSAKNPKFPKGIVWRKKLADTATASDVQILA